MKTKLTRFARLRQKAKDTLTRLYIQIPRIHKNIKVPAGGCVLILPDLQTYNKLVDGLYLAEMHTGIDYNKTLDNALVIQQLTMKNLIFLIAVLTLSGCADKYFVRQYKTSMAQKAVHQKASIYGNWDRRPQMGFIEKTFFYHN